MDQRFTNIPVAGHCDSAFIGLRHTLEANMAAGEEVGCAVSVVIDGETVVDLWAGYRNAGRTLPWQRDTITDMKSVGKSVFALCILRLVSQGRMELDAPVARYWPAFAQAGKEGVTVRMLLGHMAGLPF